MCVTDYARVRHKKVLKENKNYPIWYHSVSSPKPQKT